jgi:hypothetical protein
LQAGAPDISADRGHERAAIGRFDHHALAEEHAHRKGPAIGYAAHCLDGGSAGEEGVPSLHDILLRVDRDCIYPLPDRHFAKVALDMHRSTDHAQAMANARPTSIRAIDDSSQPERADRSTAAPRSDVSLPPELGSAVGFQIRRATGVADALFSETFGEMEITAAQYAILMVVRHNPGCRTSTAGSLLGITPNNRTPAR